MQKRVPLREASMTTGVSRHTIRKWIAAKKLKSKEVMVAGRCVAHLVDIAAVKKLAKKIRVGRPPLDPR